MKRASRRVRPWALGLVTAAAALTAPASAQAAYNLTISSSTTANVSCSSGSCVATGTGANLNVSQLATNLAAGNVTVSTGSLGSEAGTITVMSSLGASSAAGNLTLQPAGGVALNGVNVTTGGSQTYNGWVTLNGDTTITAPSTYFSSTVDGSHNLTVNGPAYFGGSVGGTSALSSLYVTGPTILAGSGMATSGDQTYAGAVTLNGDTTITAPSTYFSSTVDGSHSLTVNGPAYFDGSVGGTSALSSLQVTGATILAGSGMATSGDQTYAGAVTLSGVVGISAFGGSVTFASTVDGPGGLNISGAAQATFDAPVGDGTSLSSLDVSGLSGGIVFSTPVVSVMGGNLNAPVVLNADVSFDVSNSGSLTFHNAVAGSGTLTASGPGIIYLGAADSYHSTVVKGGTLAFTNGGLGSGPVVLDGGTLMWWTQPTSTDDPSAQGLSVTANGGTLFTDSNNVTLAHGISGTGHLTTETGTGTLTLSGSNASYGGTIDDHSGTLDVTGSIDTPVTVDSGAQLNVSGATSGAVTVGSGGSLDCSGGTMTGAVTSNGGTLLGAPAAPTAVSASPGIGSAAVSFTPGAANCQPVTYRATATPGGAASSAGSSGPLTVGGLTFGIPYTFTVTATNPIGAATSGASTALSVLAGAPVATIAAPVAGATYQLDQAVTAAYSCQEGTDGPGLSSCSGTVPSGAALDTSTVGSHTFTVTATSGDGQSATSTVTYTVVESPLTLTSHRVTRTGVIVLALRIPYAGKLLVTESAPGARSLTKTFSIGSPQTLAVRLGWLHRRTGGAALHLVHLRISYLPTGGNTETRVLTLRRR